MKLFSISFFLSILLLNTFAQRDSSAFIESLKLKNQISNGITADFETDTVHTHPDYDAADDAAIWYNKADWTKSIIFGTDKTQGILAYDLKGKQIAFYEVGKINNIDLRYDFPFGDRKIDVIVGSNRTNNTIAVFEINKETGILKNIGRIEIIMPEEDFNSVYGICMFVSPLSGKYFVFVNGKLGMVQQWEIFESNGKLASKKLREYKIDGMVEGMVADDEKGILYVGQEDMCIWKINAEPDSAMKPIIIQSSGENNKNIAFDIEGLTIYHKNNGEGYLLASSQGNFSYAVFERKGANKYLGSFTITDGIVDGTEETDGIDVINKSFGKQFPNGFFIAQDGFNFDGEVKHPQNFKVVDWRKIEKVIEGWRR